MSLGSRRLQTLHAQIPAIDAPANKVTVSISQYACVSVKEWSSEADLADAPPVVASYCYCFGLVSLRGAGRRVGCLYLTGPGCSGPLLHKCEACQGGHVLLRTAYRGSLILNSGHTPNGLQAETPRTERVPAKATESQTTSADKQRYGPGHPKRKSAARIQQLLVTDTCPR